ncbi:hypothetical protein [Thermomonospora umbrina]|uniref:hypothetical protein n=1 Tax=Thermomonospora umbrina TaxID=111806 RepID=UPI0011C10F25|nr:hypothetical protein [Thermomonospora umbrina]
MKTLAEGAPLTAVDQAGDALRDALASAGGAGWETAARAAAVFGRIQSEVGDADLAVVALDFAGRLYNDNSPSMGRGREALIGLSTLVDSIGRAMLIHHRDGRRDLAGEAYDVGREFAEFLGRNGHAAPGSQLLGRRAAILNTTGGSTEGIYSPELLARMNPSDTLREGTWAAAVLNATGPHTLRQAVAATDTSRRPWARALLNVIEVNPSAKTAPRCPTERGSALIHLPTAAQAVAGGLDATRPHPNDPRLRGWRLLGREIHSCYAVASSSGELRHRLSEHAEPWGDLLLALGRAARRTGDGPGAADCAGWLRGVLTQAGPPAQMHRWGERLRAGAEELG